MKCSLCRAKNKTSEFFKKNGYQLYQCRQCSLIWYNFKYDYSKFIKKQYQKGYFTGEKELNAYFDYGKDKKNIIKNMKYYLEQIQKYKKSGKILDIGCAYGYFMEIAEKAKFGVYGIDPSSYAIKQAQKRFKNKAEKTTLTKSNFAKNNFDAITMFDVFEHLESPRANLKKAYKILKNNGLLLIATGDTESFWARLSGKKWTFYNPPQHIYYFNRKNIKKLLKQEKFKVIKIEKNGKWLSLRYILHLASTVGESKIAKLIYPFIKNNYIGRIPLYIKLNDNMLVFAQKTLDRPK